MFSKGSESERKHLVRIVIQTTNVRNAHLTNVFRCRSEYHIIAKCPKPPKENEKQQNQVSFSERENCASHK